MSASEASKGAPTMPSIQYSKEMVDIILNDEFVTSRDGGFCRFLVKWHGRPDFDATWIQKDDLHHLDPLLLGYYLSSHSLESSSFQPEGSDGAWSRLISSLDKIGSPSPMMVVIIINYLFNRTFWARPKSISIRVFYWCL